MDFAASNYGYLQGMLHANEGRLEFELELNKGFDVSSLQNMACKYEKWKQDISFLTVNMKN